LIINGGVGIGGDLYTSNISATNLTLNVESRWKIVWKKGRKDVSEAW
jgi:hypothetical protein